MLEQKVLKTPYRHIEIWLEAVLLGYSTILVLHLMHQCNINLRWRLYTIFFNFANFFLCYYPEIYSKIVSIIKCQYATPNFMRRCHGCNGNNCLLVIHRNKKTNKIYNNNKKMKIKEAILSIELTLHHYLTFNSRSFKGWIVYDFHSSKGSIISF